MKLADKHIVFRVDASLEAGTGHVMRCLTLADALSEKGAECWFICRAHPGHLAELIRTRGHHCHLLDLVPDSEQEAAGGSLLAHAGWLGCDWTVDAIQTLAILAERRPNWLVVDHYALDTHWESMLRAHVDHIMVIDDLADRSHSCDLLLDQNLGRQADDYRDCVPLDCTLLIGPRYALLRPEFARLRAYSLDRRKEPHLHELLISMGGVDLPNATGYILDMLKQCALPDDCRICVVMGANAPWLEQVRHTASTMPWATDILVGVNDMAQRMASCDLAIGAAGSTSWERCCLGVPTLMVTLAQNQLSIGNALHHQGGAILIGSPADPHFEAKFHDAMLILQSDRQQLSKMCLNGAMLTDGHGCHDIIVRMQ
ncbi:UDP-2,4-diacetamido-2,4,6-trideoxy-beta-L-altropyranose hydrolase [Aeromonas media]|uniref:UDP-2,4-diacetamido-2,4, 6-trideoxy-beta-L-altropyranose hydrolase n=1 Tax=Aeromonas media TaxID=651 RepID=UPI000FA3E1D4|nr:UDP-2,4-diacetamido-2,4,6-trideoxy-beta-L-altropyranose hydrolase [Aeromonas media]MBS4699312.1 UDP-2,4-diacetamido-2,4,6-trideoxy-beta-L-altropyranose hydrolase [Aeromonas media]QIY85808.1 UDP-2,4-diacetamido-2,4,6-trideoxy-beta-L-altropyranose hydrolase [Aeromonas hydrophila]